MLAAVNTDVLDDHDELRLRETFAMAGATARAPVLVEHGVARIAYPCDFPARYSPFLKLLRGGAEFGRMLATAERRIGALRR